MQLTTFAPHLVAFCPVDPHCPHDAPHAGSHLAVTPPPRAEDVPARPARAPKPTRAEVDAAIAEARARLAEATARWRDLDERGRP